jgi:hypothetical protein
MLIGNGEPLHGRHRPAQILDQADHHAALIGQAGVVSLSSSGLPDVCSGAGRNTDHEVSFQGGRRCAVIGTSRP